MEEDFILSGLQEEWVIPNNMTLGQYFFECLRKRDKDEVFSVNALTNEVLTCGTLLEKSCKFVSVLKTYKIEKKDVISISSNNTIEYAVPILAAFAMGVTVNLLNSHYSEGEIKHALSITKPKLVICTENTLEKIEKVAKDIRSLKSILLMGSKSDEQGEHSFTNLEVLLDNTIADSNNYKPAYFDPAIHGAMFMLSSGTTGLPKGVLITHETLKTYICIFCDPRHGEYCGNHIVLALLPFFFIFGSMALFSAFSHPVKLIVLSKFQPNIFLQAIDQYKVTKLPLTPSLVLFIAKSSLVQDYDLTSLKDAVSGGAPLGNDVLNEASKVLGGITIRQVYGLTELGACTFTAPNINKPQSIGTVVMNYKGKVWNTELEKNMGPFEIGELCFKTATRIQGYANNECTNNIIDEQGFFHTGDLGYYDNDGNFYITGRIKDVIKYKGYQVSPTEVENVLLEHPGIKDCAVIGIPNERVGELPFAFIVCKDSTILKEQEVVNYIADRISLEKQLHGGVTFINEIPRNQSGKILRNKLEKMYNEMLV